MANRNLIIAGVSFPCGAQEIGKVAFSHEFQPIYLEHLKFANSIEQSSHEVEFCERIPQRLVEQEGIFLPILESWVSEGAKLTGKDALQFDFRAASTSRSKLDLSTTMETSGLNFVPRRQVENLSSAIDAANEIGFPIVFRIDTGYSGRGVWVVKSSRELESIWMLSLQTRTREDYQEMSLVLNREVSAYVVEPYFESSEWSVAVSYTHLTLPTILLV